MPKNIKIIKDGPYHVTGNVPLDHKNIVTDNTGAAVNLEPAADYKNDGSYFLCRCGKSQCKPHCDGSHDDGFNGTTKKQQPYNEHIKVYGGHHLKLHDNDLYCAAARFCDVGENTWHKVKKTEDDHTVDEIKNEVAHCLSGRLTLYDNDNKLLEPALEQKISVIEDPYNEVHGPLWVQGGIAIENEHGETYEIRNRVTLCRCGHSHNKPFCDGKHVR